MNRVIVNTDTGEIAAYLGEGDRIVRAKSREHLANTLDIPVKNFVKLNIDELQPLLPSLSSTEQTMLINLIPYISYKTCCLQYKNGNDLNLQDIVKVTGISENTCIKAIEGLISHDILYKGKNSKNNQYFVNPWIANRGMVVNKVLKQMFKNYKVHSMGGVKWNDLPDYR